jgi:hypothetical protein
MAYLCSCTARCRVCVTVGKDYIRLEFHGTHDETSHAEEWSKKLKYKQIIAIYEAVTVAPNLSATKLHLNLQNASLKSMCNRICSDQFSGAFETKQKSLPFGNYPSVEWCPSLLDS